mgnify:CR=1 FL=1
MTSDKSILNGICAVLLDVDGTLLDYQTRLPESARAAVQEARRRGHRVYLCTGRSRAEIYPSLWEIGLDGLIGGNGSYVESDGEVVWHQVLARPVVERAVAWMESYDLAYYLESNTGLFGTDHLPEKTAVLLGGATEENIAKVRKGFPDMIYDPTQGRDEVNKISFVLQPGLDLAALAEAFAGEAGIDTWSLTGGGPEFGEFGQLGVHKGAAVRRLAAEFDQPAMDEPQLLDMAADEQDPGTRHGVTLADGTGSVEPGAARPVGSGGAAARRVGVCALVMDVSRSRAPRIRRGRKNPPIDWH